MDAAARSLVVFGGYLLANAVGLIFAPNLVLGLLGLPGTTEPWIRVLGLVAGVIGYYYIFAARNGLRPFYRASVHGRGGAVLVFVGLVSRAPGRGSCSSSAPSTCLRRCGRTWRSGAARTSRPETRRTSMLTLYYAPHSCALATHLALAHAKADFEAVKLDFSAHQQRSAEYLAINPKGRVPALVTARGVLTESPALLLYVAQMYPASQLAPLDDAFALVQFNSFNSYLCSTVHVAHAHRMRGTRWADDPDALEAMRRKVPQSVGDAFAHIERGFLRGPWVMGEAFSAADYYLLTMSRWLEGDGVDLTRLPRVLDHRARMLALPVVQQVIAQQEQPKEGMA
jgi:glutathione S-transferase